MLQVGSKVSLVRITGASGESIRPLYKPPLGEEGTVIEVDMRPQSTHPYHVAFGPPRTRREYWCRGEHLGPPQSGWAEAWARYVVEAEEPWAHYLVAIAESKARYEAEVAED